ncbi:MAG: flippase [Candidatus Paceibacterota bacterium]
MPPLSIDYIKEKWQHAGFQRYFKNIGWMFSARVFILAVAFFINAYMARYLGPANFGLLNYVFSFVGLFSFMASLGVESIANREIVSDHSKKSLIIGTSFYLKLFGSFIAILTIFVFARLSTSDVILLGLISMYSLTYVFSAFNIIETYFQSQVLAKYPALITITAGVISAILKIIAISLGAGIIWLTAIYVLESVVVASGLLFFFIFNGHSIKEWVFDKTIALMILKDSWPLMLSSIAFSVYMKIDQVMIKNMIGNEQTGIYAVASKLAEFWYFIPSTICASFFPALINAKKTGKELYERRLKKLYGFMFWLSLSIAIFTTIFAHIIIYILFGNEYLGAVNTLKIYVWAGIAISIGFVLFYYLILEGRTRINAISTIIGAILNVSLNLILIPKYGINGAAFASLFSYTAITISVLSFKENRNQVTIIFGSIKSGIRILNYK